MSCYVRSADGELVTAHAHFEGRCVTDRESDPLYAERLAAYFEGGWPAWEAVKSQQMQGEGEVMSKGVEW